jgi:hypothetical protein
MRKPVTLGIVCIICLVALLAADRIARGQAGSIGGTIGKTDKSASGGEESSASLGRYLSPASRRHPQRNGEGSVGPSSSVTGHWQWHSDCGPFGRFVGAFKLAQTSAGQLTGEFLSDSGEMKAGRISGTVTGDNVSFTRVAVGGQVTQFDAVLNSPDKPSMTGSVSGPGRMPCSFAASKE